MSRIAMEASKPKRSSYIQFAVQTIILIMLAILLGYIYTQEDRLKELEKRMAPVSKNVKDNKLTVIEALHTLLKRSEELETINNRLGMVENKVHELFMQHEEFMSVKDKTSKQLDQIRAKSQSMEQGFWKIEGYLEKILGELENTDQMLRKLNDSVAEVCNRDKSVVSSQHTLQAQLDEITTEIQTYAKTFNQIESDLKHVTEKTVQSSAIYNLGETDKDLQEHIRSHKDVPDEHSKAIEIEKGNIQNVQQHITAGDSCQTGIVAMDKPISSDEERLLKVQFGTSFSSPPVISYGIVKLDTNAPSNPRIWVTLKDQSTTGFTVSFTTWLGNACQSGLSLQSRVMDPCSCSTYYDNFQRFQTKRFCPMTELFDHINNKCRKEKEVKYLDICLPSDPLIRCDESSKYFLQIGHFCEGSIGTNVFPDLAVSGVTQTFIGVSQSTGNNTMPQTSDFPHNSGEKLNIVILLMAMLTGAVILLLSLLLVRIFRGILKERRSRPSYSANSTDESSNGNVVVIYDDIEDKGVPRFDSRQPSNSTESTQRKATNHYEIHSDDSRDNSYCCPGDLVREEGAVGKTVPEGTFNYITPVSEVKHGSVWKYQSQESNARSDYSYADDTISFDYIRTESTCSYADPFED